MELKDEFEVPLPVAEAWAVLTDLEKIVPWVFPQWLKGGDPFGIPGIYPALAVSVTMLVVVSLLTDPPTKEELAPLFEKKPDEAKAKAEVQGDVQELEPEVEAKAKVKAKAKAQKPAVAEPEAASDDEASAPEPSGSPA